MIVFSQGEFRPYAGGGGVINRNLNRTMARNYYFRHNLMIRMLIILIYISALCSCNIVTKKQELPKGWLYYIDSTSTLTAISVDNKKQFLLNTFHYIMGNAIFHQMEKNFFIVKKRK